VAKKVAKKARPKTPTPASAPAAASWKKKVLTRIASDIRDARKKTSLRGLNSYYKDGGGIYGKGNFGKSERPQ
jgi:hypothetical protein